MVGSGCGVDEGVESYCRGKYWAMLFRLRRNVGIRGFYRSDSRSMIEGLRMPIRIRLKPVKYRGCGHQLRTTDVNTSCGYRLRTLTTDVDYEHQLRTLGADNSCGHRLRTLPLEAPDLMVIVEELSVVLG